MNRQINDARERGDKQLRDLEQRKEQQVREIRENSERQMSYLRDQNNSTANTINQLRSQVSEIESISSALSSFYGSSGINSTDFSSKSLVGRVYYLKSEFDRVVGEREDLRKNRDYWQAEEQKERERAQEAERSRDFWSREETRERERTNQLQAKIQQADDCKIM